MKSIFLASLCLISSAIMMTSCSNGDYTASPDKSGASNPIYQPTPIGVNGTGGGGNSGNNGNGGASNNGGAGTFTWTDGGKNYSANYIFCYDTTLAGQLYFQILAEYVTTSGSTQTQRAITFQMYRHLDTAGTYAIGQSGSTVGASLLTATVSSSGGVSNAVTYSGISGSFIFTSISVAGGYLKGTFSFTGKSASGTTVDVTNGQFNIKKTH